MNKKHLFSLLSISCVFSLGSATAEPAAYRHYTFDTVSDNATPDTSSHQAHALLSGQELCEGVIGQALQFKAGSKGLALGDLGNQRLNELNQVIHLLQLAAGVLIDTAVTCQYVERFQQRNRLTRTQFGQLFVECFNRRFRAAFREF